MRKEMNIQAVAEDIRALIAHEPKLVKRIGIFGSLARGDYNNDSDIDLLVEYDMPPSFVMKLYTSYCELCNKIEETLMELYQRKVDIVHFENDSLSNLFDKNVEDEVVWL